MAGIRLQLRRMSAAEAFTVSTDIHTEVTAAAKELGEDVLTQEVLDAAKELTQAAEPLGEAKEFPHETRFAIDRAGDAVSAGINNTLNGKLQTYDQDEIKLTPKEQEEREAAQTLQMRCFPDGTGYLNESWYEQYGITRHILKETAKKENKGLIATLGMKGQFALLARVHKEYGRRMGYTTAEESADDPLDLWYEALELYLLTVMTKHRKHEALSNRLQRPYLKLIENQQARRRRQRSKDANTPTQAES